MLAIHSTSTEKSLTPNIIPCAIKHNGPITASQRYWNPSTEQDGTSTSFFRGRKLRGKKVSLPTGYEGAVLEKTEKKVVPKPRIPVPGEEEDGLEGGHDAPKEVETLIMDKTAGFEHVVVWDHEVVPGAEDIYVKGVEEWIGFAEAVSSEDALHTLLWFIHTD